MPRALWQKLGYTPATVAVLDGEPDDYLERVAPLPDGVTFTDDLDSGPTFVHLFTTQRADLASALAIYTAAITRDGMIWVSWPKGTSRMATDMSGDAVRAAALPLGLVDVKVCSIDATWTALKLMIRKELR